MTRLPACSPAQVCRALERAGFSLARTRGSHHYYRDSSGRLVSVPVHAGRDIKRGTLQNIIKAAGLTRDEFLELL